MPSRISTTLRRVTRWLGSKFCPKFQILAFTSEKFSEQTKINAKVDYKCNQIQLKVSKNSLKRCNFAQYGHTSLCASQESTCLINLRWFVKSQQSLSLTQVCAQAFFLSFLVPFILLGQFLMFFSSRHCLAEWGRAIELNP